MNSTEASSFVINDNFFEYIKNNISCKDTSKLLLKKENVEFDKKFAITQIECRNKFKTKIPEILSNQFFLFPKMICGEQCTHELVAKLHASLFNRGDVVLDMTMGLGVDSYYISKVAKSVTSIECDKDIALINQMNYRDMAPNINLLNDNSIEYISNRKERYSAIFIDPARRDANNKRMFGFHDCMPDVIDLMPHIKRCTDRLIVKASPMLDISKSLEELCYVTDIWIVAIKNSCKELLFVLDFTKEERLGNVRIHTIDYEVTTQCFDFFVEPASDFGCIAASDDVSAGTVLLEPNACIIKSGRTESLITAFESLKKLEKNSHLFVSKCVVKDFPGRQFIIEDVIPFKDKNLRKFKEYKTLNVSTRNFRLSADQLKARIGVIDGGDKYLFGTTLSNSQQVLILCRKA